MVVCESCDKAYHIYCAQPVLTSVPKQAWRCKVRTLILFDITSPSLLQNCRQCSDCGSRSPGSGVSSRWHLKYTVCDSCYQQVIVYIYTLVLEREVSGDLFCSETRASPVRCARGHIDTSSIAMN